MKLQCCCSSFVNIPWRIKVYLNRIGKCPRWHKKWAAKNVKEGCCQSVNPRVLMLVCFFFSCFFLNNGIVHYEFIEHGTPVNQHNLEILKRLPYLLTGKDWNSGMTEWILHHDKAPAQTFFFFYKAPAHVHLYISLSTWIWLDVPVQLRLGEIEAAQGGNPIFCMLMEGERRVTEMTSSVCCFSFHWPVTGW